MSDRTENRLFIIGMILFILCLGGVIVGATLGGRDTANDRCKAYCECQVEECPYVFDYDAVKYCECK